MSFWDWLIVGGLLVVLFAAAFYTRRFTRNVADFLVANRCAGRYLLAVSSGISAVGAIAFIAFFENVFSAGVTNTWWALADGFVVGIMMVSGWVVYRFRQTRALTLAQFLEMRYSRRFRVFAGMICWLSGIINFGVFPAIGTRFLWAPSSCRRMRYFMVFRYIRCCCLFSSESPICSRCSVDRLR